MQANNGSEKPVKNYAEIYGNRSSSLNGARESQAIISIAGHSRQKLSKKSEKDRFISQLLVHIWKDARFTCYSDNGITRT